MSLSNKEGPPGKYWESMDAHDDNDDDHASWVGQFFNVVGGGSWDTTGEKENDKEEQPSPTCMPVIPSIPAIMKPQPVDPPPSSSQAVSTPPPPTEKKAVEKAVLHRTSTVSTTILDSSELFDDSSRSPNSSSSDLYHDGQEGWEVVLGERNFRHRFLQKYTRHPHFVKRCGICTILSVLMIVLISVLCATLTGNDVPVVTSGATAGTSGNETVGGNEEPTEVPVPAPEGDENDDLKPPAGTVPPSSGSMDLNKPAAPFSTLDPVDQLGMFGVVHSRIPPTTLNREDSANKATPTNAWYENLIHGASAGDALSAVHKAYPVPYLVDVVGPIPGLRVHPTHLDTTDTMVQAQVVEPHGLTLGASGSSLDKTYSIASTSPLGVTLQWNALPMTSTIVRGMPYSTMHYPKPLSADFKPTIAAEVALESPPLVDGAATMDCNTNTPVRVEKELSLTFQSDYTWMVFFSEPVMVQCIDNGSSVQWQVVELADDSVDTSQLTIRASLLTSCTNGLNGIYCSDETAGKDTTNFQTLLRERSNIYPGPNADVRYGVDTSSGKATVRLDWDAQDMTNDADSDTELLMYALPHHLTRMREDSSKWMPWADGNDEFCMTSLLGSSCAVTGSVWDLTEDLPIASFRAPRPPRVEALPVIAEALQRDIQYVIPANFQRGAGDTYFSGKVLARVGRVLLIHEELEDLCNGKAIGYTLNNEEKLAYMNACRDLTLPSDDDINKAMNMFRSSVQVWINGTAEASFAYDSGWGGVISCGCLWDQGTQGCSNRLPDCPATSDQGLNFGNGYYNDHHFHYGYHVYAAAALTHFDQEWGRRHFEDVLLLIRDYANPSDDDVFFPRFRNKDWYQGSSWASGITEPIFGNIMNQESTSEAIAGYEAIALFGKEMMLVWNQVNEPAKVEISRDIRDVGLVTAATEIRSTDYYWHVRRENDERNIYPSGFRHQVVGILWATMAQFTTWFGNAPYLIYGIQLLPLTPIAENRDASQEWLREMYQPLANSCAADSGCTLHGWSVLQLAIMASIGNVDMAMERAKSIPDQAFDSPGGNGHSMTNTLHYFATRPEVAEPAVIPETDLPTDVVVPDETAIDCGVPQTCTPEALSVIAAGYTCRERITWLMDWQGMDEAGACEKVARAEFPNECGGCIATQSNTAASVSTGENGGVRRYYR